MRKVYIYIDDDNSYHKCEVSSIKKSLLTNIYSIYFFDPIYDAYYVSDLDFIKGEFYISDIHHEVGEINFLDTLLKSTHKKIDIKHLQPIINSLKHKKCNKSDIYLDNKEKTALTIKKIDYLELISFADATNTKYLYFIIDDMNVSDIGYEYTLRLVTESNVRLKKNVVATHATIKSLSDLFLSDGYYHLSFEKNDKVNVDTYKESRLVTSLYNHFKNKYDLDTEILTKIVRIMLGKEDYIEAIKQYNYYLNTYYVPYLKDKKAKEMLIEKH